MSNPLCSQLLYDLRCDLDLDHEPGRTRDVWLRTDLFRDLCASPDARVEDDGANGFLLYMGFRCFGREQRNPVILRSGCGHVRIMLSDLDLYDHLLAELKRRSTCCQALNEWQRVKMRGNSWHVGRLRIVEPLDENVGSFAPLAGDADR